MVDLEAVSADACKKMIFCSEILFDRAADDIGAALTSSHQVLPHPRIVEMEVSHIHANRREDKMLSQDAHSQMTRRSWLLGLQRSERRTRTYVDVIRRDVAAGPYTILCAIVGCILIALQFQDIFRTS